MAGSRWAPVRPDHHFADRALRALASYLDRQGMLQTVLRASQDAPTERVKLPGFHLADIGNHISPYMWCVPRPIDDAQVINVYEEFVNRELGRISRPDTVARRLYASPTTGRRYFGRSANPGGWLVPGMKLVLAAAHFDGGVHRVRGGLRADLGEYRLEVTNRGCWSNLQGKYLPFYTHYGRTDDAMTVPATSTMHPLAVTLVRLDAPPEALWAANSGLRSRPALARVPADVLLRARLEGHMRRRAITESFELAVREAMEIAQLAGENVIVQLYEAMVPTVCTAKKFRSHFGNPWKASEHRRRVAPETRAKWVEYIEQLARPVDADA